MKFFPYFWLLLFIKFVHMRKINDELKIMICPYWGWNRFFKFVKIIMLLVFISSLCSGIVVSIELKSIMERD